jgi:hypothetical protein
METATANDGQIKADISVMIDRYECAHIFPSGKSALDQIEAAIVMMAGVCDPAPVEKKCLADLRKLQRKYNPRR